MRAPAEANLKVPNSQENFWSYKQAAVWFAFRSETVVDMSYGDWETFGEFVERKSVDVDGLPAFQAEKAVAARLRQKPFKMVLDALRSGELGAFGNFLGGKGIRPIPADFWRSHQQSIRAASGQVAGEAFFVLGMLADDVKRFWPSSDDPAAGGPRSRGEIKSEEAAAAFFAKLGPWSPDIPTKRAAMRRAADQFPGLSGRALLRAWERGAHDTRHAPGPRRRGV